MIFMDIDDDVSFLFHSEKIQNGYKYTLLVSDAFFDKPKNIKLSAKIKNHMGTLANLDHKYINKEIGLKKLIWVLSRILENKSDWKKSNIV